MANRKTSLAVSFGLALFLGACASHTWAPGPDAKGTYEEASAKCSLLARHSGGGFYAQGTPSFVAGATLGAAVGEAIRTQTDFNDCMAATGWVVADAGSANTAQAQTANTQIATIRGDLNTCLDVVRSNPKYGPLTRHLLNVADGHYTLTQMSDNSRPTAQETSLLATYGDETDVCREKSIAQISAMDPRAGQTIQRMNARVRDLDLALINRQITWGDYARQCQNVFESAGAPSSVAASNDNPSTPPNTSGYQRYDAWQQKSGQ